MMDEFAYPKRLLALVDLQADPGLRGGWDVSWWIGVVLFEGWECWWEAAESVRPLLSPPSLPARASRAGAATTASAADHLRKHLHRHRNSPSLNGAGQVDPGSKRAANALDRRHGVIRGLALRDPKTLVTSATANRSLPM